MIKTSKLDTVFKGTKARPCDTCPSAFRWQTKPSLQGSLTRLKPPHLPPLHVPSAPRTHFSQFLDQSLQVNLSDSQRLKSPSVWHSPPLSASSC